MCKNCNPKTVFTLINGRKLCRSCFIHYFEKKILFTIRKYKLFEKNDKLFIEKGKYQNILTSFFSKLLIYKLNKTKKGKKLLSTSTDEIASRIIFNQLKKKQEIKQLMPKYQNTIKPLFLLLDKEIELYAKLKGIKIINCEKQDKLAIKVREFLDDLEKKHPEIKYATMNAFLEIQPVLD